MLLNNRSDFDVIVLGTGIAGTMLSCILAKHGRSVLMIDNGVHPRFAIGESTIPQTSQLISLVAREFGVHEFHHIGLNSPGELRKHVTNNCGIKRLFGFAFHRLGEAHRTEEAHQFGNVWRDENHLFRQDIDSYLYHLAVGYGARGLQSTQIQAVNIDERGAQVVAGGRSYSARFVVDGTGHKSILADKYGLRDNPCPMVSSSRSIFTHVVNVGQFEDTVGKRLTEPFNRGTLHHIFKRGWFWVIPFNNWEGAPNPLVSVGVTVDDRYWPEDPKLSPEEEFESFVQKLPSVIPQFRAAYAIRPWVRTKRIQYSSHRTIGPRFALLSHAAGFIDPLFSRGLISTLQNLRTLSRALLDALHDDDFAVDRFEGVDREQIRNFSFADRIVAAAYSSWDDFELWNAWVRVWAIGAHAAESRLGSVMMLGAYSKIKECDNPVCSTFEEPGYRAFFEATYAIMARYEAKELTVEQAREALWGEIDRYAFTITLPGRMTGHEWALRNPRVRNIHLGTPALHERWTAGRTDDGL